jgi:hypothetical protein
MKIKLIIILMLLCLLSGCVQSQTKINENFANCISVVVYTVADNGFFNGGGDDCYIDKNEYEKFKNGTITSINYYISQEDFIKGNSKGIYMSKNITEIRIGRY